VEPTKNIMGGLGEFDGLMNYHRFLTVRVNRVKYFHP